MTSEKELFQISKVLMLYSGLWIPQWSKWLGKFFKLISLSVQIFYLVCMPLFSVEICVTIGSDTDAAINALKSLSFVIVLFAKMVVIQSKKTAHLIEFAWKKDQEIRSSVEADIKKIYRPHVKFINATVWVIVVCMYFSGCTYIIDGLHQSYQFYKTHTNITATTPKPHIVPLWFPFNKEEYYKTAMAYQISHVLLTLAYNGAAQALVHSVLIFLRAEMKILQHYIRHIDACSSDARNVIKSCIVKHQELIRWTHEFNSSFQYIVLLEYCLTSLTLATILIDGLQGRKLVFNSTYFMLTTSQIFALSWNANEIILESSSGLSDALYECTWYNLDGSSKALILFMIMRCKKPLKISIGPFGAMDLDAAASRMKLSYSVVSVLTTSSAT